MADDWIKKRKKLIDDPRTVALANRLNATGQHILGCLDLLWSLADSFADPETGLLKGYSAALIDQKVRHPGFAEACVAATRNHPDGAWLILKKTGVIFPEYGSHNGKTAKVRAQTAKRVAKFRAADVTQDVTQPPLPDQTRPEEIRKEQPPPADERGALVEYARLFVDLSMSVVEVGKLINSYGFWWVVEALEHLASHHPSDRFAGIQYPDRFVKSLCKRAMNEDGLERGDYEYRTFSGWTAEVQAKVPA